MATPVQALVKSGAGEEVCAEATAYASKVRKAERKRRREEAKQKAQSELVLQVLTEAFGPELGNRSGVYAGELSDTAEAPDNAIAMLRFRYHADDRLAGGRHVFIGDRHSGAMAYCVSSDLFRDVRDQLRRQREQTLQSLQERFSELEALIADAEPRVASEALADLEIDVINEAAEEATYRSAVDGRERPLYVWLDEWGNVVDKGPAFVADMTDKAEQLFEQGYLNEADRYLQQALAADRENVRAQELRHSIHRRQIDRAELLRKAERLAAEGQFAAADQRLEQAVQLDRGDPTPIRQARSTVDGLQAEYLEYNPARSVYVYTATGALGADTKRIEERVRADTGLEVDASPPFSFGVGSNFRLGRFFFAGVSGGYGASLADSDSPEIVTLGLYQIYQFSGGLGVRRPRGPRRAFGFQLSGGLTWESVDIPVSSPNGLDSDGSQAAAYLRFVFEWAGSSLFVQHGLGFENSADSLVGWSDTLQFGGAFVF